MHTTPRAKLDVLTVKDVARILRVSDETIRRRCREKSMPHFRMAGQIRFRHAELDAWIDELSARALEQK